MPTFTTPEPILVSLDLAAGDARISAGERDDTVVEVAPRDASRRADVRAAEQTRVEFADGRLVVRTPRQGLSFSRGWAVDVTIALPAGSRVQGRTGVGELHADGTLADCTFKSGAGAIRLGKTGPLHVASGAGDITVDSVGGDVRVTTANGDITVDRAARNLIAKTANGNVRVGAVARGSVEVTTASGSIEIGVVRGTAARLDVKTQFGNVDQQLDAAEAPPPSGEKVEIRGRTGFGDITVRRA